MDTIRDIYSYIDNSPKRAMELKLGQESVELKPVRKLLPCATRWAIARVVHSLQVQVSTMWTKCLFRVYS